MGVIGWVGRLVVRAWWGGTREAELGHNLRAGEKIELLVCAVRVSEKGVHVTRGQKHLIHNSFHTRNYFILPS